MGHRYRVAKTVPYSGMRPHRDHRSKKGRGKRDGSKLWGDLRHEVKQKIEIIRIKDLEDDINFI